MWGILLNIVKGLGKVAISTAKTAGKVAFEPVKQVANLGKSAVNTMKGSKPLGTPKTTAGGLVGNTGRTQSQMIGMDTKKFKTQMPMGAQQPQSDQETLGQKLGSLQTPQSGKKPLLEADDVAPKQIIQDQSEPLMTQQTSPLAFNQPNKPLLYKNGKPLTDEEIQLLLGG